MSVRQGTPSKNAVRALAVSCIAAAGLLASAGGARAAVTIGQTPLSTPPTSCTVQQDVLQPSVTSATRYVVPDTIAQGTITSWSHRAAAGSGQQVTLKVFRDAGGGSFRVVGTNGPRGLNPSSLNTFNNVSVPVRAGDVLGLNSANAATVNNACTFSANGDRFLSRAGDLPDGGSGTFASVPDSRVNVSARIEPLNTFTFASIFRSRRKGFAIVQVALPNPGTLSVRGTGVANVSSTAHSSVRVGGPGTVSVLIRATGRKRLKLRRRGRVFVAPSFRYTPTSGSRRSQTLIVKLRQKRKKR